MSDLEPVVDEEPARAHPAGVITQENPHTDPITVAYSKVDVLRSFIVEQDDEVERMRGKVERAQSELAAARMALDESTRRGPALEAQLGEALEELNAARAADPKLADIIESDRARQIDQRKRELRDALNALGGE